MRPGRPREWACLADDLATAYRSAGQRENRSAAASADPCRNALAGHKTTASYLTIKCWYPHIACRHARRMARPYPRMLPPRSDFRQTSSRRTVSPIRPDLICDRDIVYDPNDHLLRMFATDGRRSPRRSDEFTGCPGTSDCGDIGLPSVCAGGLDPLRWFLGDVDEGLLLRGLELRPPVPAKLPHDPRPRYLPRRQAAG